MKIGLFAALLLIVTIVLASGAGAISQKMLFEDGSTATTCTSEGGSIPVIASPPKCCEGLTLIPPKEANILGSMGICTAKCGNGVCDETESIYNCPKDCGTTCKGESEMCGGIAGFACCEGLTCQYKETYPDATGVCVRQTTTCTDSDNGRNYFEIGKTCIGEKCLTDSCAYCTGLCVEGTACRSTCGAVLEYYCEGGAIQSETIVCKEGYACSNGACVSSQQNGFYISSVWTDKTNYTIGTDSEIIIYAKILDFDGTPSTRAEGTTAYAAVTGKIYVPTDLIPLEYNYESGYYEAKTNVPNYESTFIVSVTAKNPDKNPASVTGSGKFIVSKTGGEEIVYAPLGEKFSLNQNQQANIWEGSKGNVVIKMKFDSVIGLMCEQNATTGTATNATAPSIACGGTYAQFSISTASGIQTSISLAAGQSTTVGEYKITLGGLAMNMGTGTYSASLLVEKASDTIVYARLDQEFFLKKGQTAVIEEAGLKMALIEIVFSTTSCPITADGTKAPCVSGPIMAVLQTNQPPYKVEVKLGSRADIGNFVLKFLSSNGSDAGLVVSKKTTIPDITVGLNEKFELKIPQSALIKETGMKIRLTGIKTPNVPTPAPSAAGGGSGAATTGNVIAPAATTTSNVVQSTSVQSVSSTGEVKVTSEQIRIDPRPVAVLSVEMPVVCIAENDTTGSIRAPCTGIATEIYLRQGESRTFSGYAIHALWVGSQSAVFMVQKAVDNFIAVELDEEFKLRQSQTAFVNNAELFLRVNSIGYAKCGTENTEGETKCIGGQFAKITVWQDSYGIKENTSMAIREITVYQGSSIEMYGYKITLNSLLPDVAYFIVSSGNSNEINVHVNEPFKLAENMRANVLEANIKIEVLGLSDDSVKFGVSNYLYSKEYIGKTVAKNAIEETIATSVSSIQESIPEIPPMPFNVYTLKAGESIEIGDYTISVLETNPSAAVFVVKEKGLNKNIVIQINKGWNLFSLPGDLTSESSNCNSSNFKIFEYDASLKKFSPVSNPKIGKAYWLYHPGQSCTAKAVLKKPASVYDLDAIEKGWNFIGIIPDMIGKTINDFGNCKFKRAYLFNSASQKWESALTKKISENELGEALAVYSEEACKWVSSGIDEEPPMPPEV